jgi:hypothetical protein
VIDYTALRDRLRQATRAGERLLDGEQGSIHDREEIRAAVDVLKRADYAASVLAFYTERQTRPAS